MLSSISIHCVKNRTCEISIYFDIPTLIIIRRISWKWLRSYPGEFWSINSHAWIEILWNSSCFTGIQVARLIGSANLYRASRVHVGLHVPERYTSFETRHDVIDSCVSHPAQSSPSLSLGHLKPRPSSRHLNITFRTSLQLRKNPFFRRETTTWLLFLGFFRVFLELKKKRQFFLHQILSWIRLNLVRNSSIF